jgi:hypothetical protein
VKSRTTIVWFNMWRLLAEWLAFLAPSALDLVEMRARWTEL